MHTVMQHECYIHCAGIFFTKMYKYIMSLMMMMTYNDDGEDDNEDDYDI